MITTKKIDISFQFCHGRVISAIRFTHTELKNSINIFMLFRLSDPRKIVNTSKNWRIGVFTDTLALWQEVWSVWAIRLRMRDPRTRKGTYGLIPFGFVLARAEHTQRGRWPMRPANG